LVKHKPEPLTDEEVKRILDVSSKNMTKRGRRDHLILRLLVKTGARLGELQRIRPKDVDFGTKTIYIYKAKYDSRREVPFDTMTSTLLSYWLSDHPDLKKSDSIWTTNKGAPLSVAQIKRIPAKYAKIAGIQKVVSCHSFRHFFCTKLLRDDVNPYKVKSLMGHGNFNATDQYANIVSNDARKDYDKSMEGW
jgi:integrase/recombinase XerD